MRQQYLLSVEKQNFEYDTTSCFGNKRLIERRVSRNDINNDGDWGRVDQTGAGLRFCFGGDRATDDCFLSIDMFDCYFVGEVESYLEKDNSVARGA